MTIDFTAMKEASRNAPLKPLFAVLIGPQGAGKSTAMGTFGVPTLILHTNREHHGPDAAKAIGGDVTGIEFTKYKKDGSIDPDASFENLLTVLNDPGLSDNFGAVCIDSLTDLQKLFRKSNAFYTFCRTEKTGAHNTYREGDSDSEQFLRLLDALLNLQKKGLHVAVSMAATVKSQNEDGSVAEATPGLSGFSVATDIIRAFSDVLLVSRLVEMHAKMVGNDEVVEGKVAHKFIFKANLSKSSKDIKSGAILKTSNFTPRITGFIAQDLPDTCDADLSKIIAARLKKANKNK